MLGCVSLFDVLQVEVLVSDFNVSHTVISSWAVVLCEKGLECDLRLARYLCKSSIVIFKSEAVVWFSSQGFRVKTLNILVIIKSR